MSRRTLIASVCVTAFGALGVLTLLVAALYENATAENLVALAAGVGVGVGSVIAALRARDVQARGWPERAAFVALLVAGGAVPLAEDLPRTAEIFVLAVIEGFAVATLVLTLTIWSEKRANEPDPHRSTLWHKFRGALFPSRRSGRDSPSTEKEWPLAITSTPGFGDADLADRIDEIIDEHVEFGDDRAVGYEEDGTIVLFVDYVGLTYAEAMRRAIARIDQLLTRAGVRFPFEYE